MIALLSVESASSCDESSRFHSQNDHVKRKQLCSKHLVTLASSEVALSNYTAADSMAAGEPIASSEPATPEPTAGDWRQTLVTYQPWILAAWLAGVVLLCARLALGGLLLTRLRATADALPEAWATRAETIRRRLGAARRVVIKKPALASAKRSPPASSVR